VEKWIIGGDSHGVGVLVGHLGGLSKNNHEKYREIRDMVLYIYILKTDQTYG
jgi:hypothetical protein